MSRILIVAEHDGAKLNPSTLKCVACAAKVPGDAVDVAFLDHYQALSHLW